MDPVSPEKIKYCLPWDVALASWNDPLLGNHSSGEQGGVIGP